MLKNFIFGFGTAVAIILLGGFALMSGGLIPANADATPSGLELWVAGTSLDAALKRNAPTEKNPVPLTEQNLILGIQLYAHNCAVCHGAERGEPSRSPIAKGLYPRPPQLATNGVEDDPDGYSFWRIKHGIRLTGMPSFASALGDAEIWTLALFLKNMDKLPPSVQEVWKNVQNWPIAIPVPAAQK
jgi:mono/diheme cytochrome c family protein